MKLSHVIQTTNMLRILHLQVTSSNSMVTQSMSLDSMLVTKNGQPFKPSAPHIAPSSSSYHLRSARPLLSHATEQQKRREIEEQEKKREQEREMQEEFQKIFEEKQKRTIARRNSFRESSSASNILNTYLAKTDDASVVSPPPQQQHFIKHNSVPAQQYTIQQQQTVR